MIDKLQFETVLVPIDLSPVGEAAFRRALTLVHGDNPVLFLLHVVDSSLIEFAVAHGWGSSEQVSEQMRTRAHQQLQRYQEQAESHCEVEVIVSQGVPFLEILQKAEDFAVDAIVVGKVATRETVEKLLFGSTAEKVIRGSRRPVIVLPVGA